MARRDGAGRGEPRRLGDGGGVVWLLACGMRGVAGSVAGRLGLPQRANLAGEAREESVERVRWLPAALPCHSLAAALHWALWHNYCRGAAGSGTLIGFSAAVPSDWLWEKFPSLTPPSRLPSAYSPEGFSFSAFCKLSILPWSGVEVRGLGTHTHTRFDTRPSPTQILLLVVTRAHTKLPKHKIHVLVLLSVLRRLPGNPFPKQLWPSSQSQPTNRQLGTSGFHSLAHLCT